MLLAQSIMRLLLTFSSAKTLGSIRLIANSKLPFLYLSCAIFKAYIGVD